jgi:O-antigen/teichoic acid export membrane protein
MIANNFLSSLGKEKKIIKNSLFIFSSSLVSAILSTTSNLIFSRFFGPVGFGIFKTAFSLASTGAYSLDFGLRYLLTRYIAEFEGKKQPENITHLIKRSLLFKVIVAIFALLFLFLFRQQIAQIFFHDENLSFLILPIAVLFTIIFFDITSPVLLGYQNFKLLALISILVPLFNILFGLPMAFVWGLEGILFGSCLAFITGNIPAIKFILQKIQKKSKFRSFSFKTSFVTYSIPAYFAYVPSYVTIVIIPLLSLFFSQRQVGFYSLSFSFYTAAQLIPVTLSNVMFPKVAKLHSQKKSITAFQTFKRLIIIYTPLAILGSFLIIPLTQPIIGLLVPSFLPAVRIIIIQTIAAFFLGYFSITVNYAIATGKLKIATILNWTLSILFLILAFSVTGLVQ